MNDDGGIDYRHLPSFLSVHSFLMMRAASMQTDKNTLVVIQIF
jgi:hypothetical protein